MDLSLPDAAARGRGGTWRAFDDAALGGRSVSRLAYRDNSGAFSRSDPSDDDDHDVLAPTPPAGYLRFEGVLDASVPATSPWLRRSGVAGLRWDARGEGSPICLEAPGNSPTEGGREFTRLWFLVRENMSQEKEEGTKLCRSDGGVDASLSADASSSSSSPSSSPSTPSPPPPPPPTVDGQPSGRQLGRRPRRHGAGPVAGSPGPPCAGDGAGRDRGVGVAGRVPAHGVSAVAAGPGDGAAGATPDDARHGAGAVACGRRRGKRGAFLFGSGSGAGVDRRPIGAARGPRTCR